MLNRRSPFRKTDLKKTHAQTWTNIAQRLYVSTDEGRKQQKPFSPNRQTKSFFFVTQNFSFHFSSNEGQMMRLNTSEKCCFWCLSFFHSFYYLAFHLFDETKVFGLHTEKNANWFCSLVPKKDLWEICKKVSESFFAGLICFWGKHCFWKILLKKVQPTIQLINSFFLNITRSLLEFFLLFTIIPPGSFLLLNWV